MLKIIQTIMTTVLGELDDDMENWKPADKIERQDWQEVAEQMIQEVRHKTRRPAFGLSETEISLSYHQPVSQFAALIESKLC